MGWPVWPQKPALVEFQAKVNYRDHTTRGTTHDTYVMGYTLTPPNVMANFEQFPHGTPSIAPTSVEWLKVSLPHAPQRMPTGEYKSYPSVTYWAPSPL